MRFFGILAASFMLAILTGCAATTALNGENKAQIDSQLHNRTMAVETPEATGFRAASASSVFASGLIFVPGVNVVAASAVATHKGTTILTENHIEDPALKISSQLASRLIKKYGLKRVEQGDTAADVAFSVQTTNWSTTYFLSDPNNYWTAINFQARLYDKKTGKGILEGVCSYNPKYDNTDDAPKWDYLFENGAVGFKKLISEAQAKCTDEFAHDIFGL